MKKRFVVGGTRHSAALGLSEVSDSLIIVVSEESGVVGVALDGRLKEIRSRDELKQTLSDFSEAKFPTVSQATWQLYLTEQWRLKLVSLVITSAAWFIFAYQPSTVQRTYIVPVEYRNIPKTLMLENRGSYGGSCNTFGFRAQISLSRTWQFGDLHQLDESRSRATRADNW